MKLSQVEKRLIEIDAELSQLAQTSLRGEVGSIGYCSNEHQPPTTPNEYLFNKSGLL